MKLIKEFFRYCIVGGLAFLIDFGILVLLTEVSKLDYKLSAICGFVAGLIVNYILSKVFVFKQEVKKEVKAFIIFSFVGVVGLGLTELGMWLGSDVWKFDYRIAKVAMTGVVLIWNYTGRKILVFNKRQEKE